MSDARVDAISDARSAEAIADPALQRTCRNYVMLFCAVSGVVLAAVSTLNYQVDPYLTHQWESPLLQRLRPVREKLSAWGKTYALARLQPAVLYLGNSRTELGLPTKVAQFDRKSVFNGALSGASVGDAITVARHAARVSRLQTVVWGIDAPSFSMVIGSTELEPELVADGPFFFARRALLNLKRALTLDMTGDSLRLLHGSFGAVCLSSLALHGQRDEACIADRIDGWGGTTKAMAPRLREFGRGDGPTMAALTAFDASVTALCRAGTRVRLYINPTHALTLEALYWRQKWDAMEQWQRDLAALGSAQRGKGCDVRVHDFSGYNSVTTEAIPLVSGRREMAYYWEASHYRAHVGQMVLQRIFGAEARADIDTDSDAGAESAITVPDDFGVELDSATIEPHLARLRAGRDRYQREHAEETAFVRALTVDEMRRPKP